MNLIKRKTDMEREMNITLQYAGDNKLMMSMLTLFKKQSPYVQNNINIKIQRDYFTTGTYSQKQNAVTPIKVLI